ncbi:unnamed protein product [Cylicocyclus nassatus]|uniref:F-box domain-containing protein n=1 Tax=Cylicocyclus nassatus TaxID=53992 RepID=A0AA36DTF9_CYLNA|nr:unnamed protein product [Cylicocyclus nassatus]
MNEDSIPNPDVDVFEDHFAYWNKLPTELKVKVVRNLPYPTLRNFMFLSKDCMEVSSPLKTPVFAVFLLHWGYRSECVQVGRYDVVKQSSIIVYYMPFGSAVDRKEYIIYFSTVEDGRCIAHREKKRGQIVIMGPEYPKESCFTVSMRVLFQITKILKPKNILLQLVNIADVKSTLSELPSTSFITCGALTVRSDDLSFLPLLMPHVSPGCELRFYNSDPYPYDDNILNPVFFDFEVVKAAPYLDTDAICEINDGQLIQLRASWLDLKASGISERGINGLILQWVEGRRKIVKICILETKTFNHDLVLENVNTNRIQSSCENIPFFNKYVEHHPLHKRLALLRNDFDDRLLVCIGEDYCELVDPYSEYMSRTYR